MYQKCSVAKLACFGTKWGLKSWGLFVDLSMEFVILFIFGEHMSKYDFQILAAVTCNTIWRYRNAMIFDQCRFSVKMENAKTTTKFITKGFTNLCNNGFDWCHFNY